MHSGSDSTESQNYAQWALNPAQIKKMSSDQVDWAALAQQWIIMKEAGPPPPLLAAKADATKPPPPKGLTEGGEAPMDVENDKEESGEYTQGDWNWAQNQWGWNNVFTPPPTGVPPPPVLKPPLLPTPGNFNQFASPPPESVSDNATFGAGYSTLPPNNDFASGYWTAAGASKVKPHNRRFSKVNIPKTTQPVLPENPAALDAAKRKQLPAWIREGLEKMERDKQKQMEKEKEKEEREKYNEKLKQNEKETMEILKTTIKEQQKSKFESDGEDSDTAPAVVVTFTPEEQMMNVRRTMTEILLKVTNREIESICREELQRHQKKLKATDHRSGAPSGANISSKLGLGIYGGSGSGSSGSESSPERKDSDTDLKDSIKRRRAEFSKTEREIETKLSVAEGRKEDSASRTPSPEKTVIDTQVDAKSPGKPRKKTTPQKRRSSSSSASSYADRKGGRSSTTSSSGRDSKKSSKRAARSRSRTPERPRKGGRVKQRSRSSSRRRYRRSRSRKRSRRSRSRSRRRRSRSSSSSRGKRSRRR